MTREFLYEFISKHQWAVVSTVNVQGHPESAVVGIAVSHNLELIFDTLSSTRKFANLQHKAETSFVIGWDHEQTIQYEGIAEVVHAAASHELIDLYLRKFPEGAERRATWKDLVYIVVKPQWIRFSDYKGGALIEELRF